MVRRKGLYIPIVYLDLLMLKFILRLLLISDVYNC